LLLRALAGALAAVVPDLRVRHHYPYATKRRADLAPATALPPGYVGIEPR
jgi:hypothetical protein